MDDLAARPRPETFGEALVNGKERRARAIARGTPNVPARTLAKKSGLRVEDARRILADEALRRGSSPPRGNE